MSKDNDHLFVAHGGGLLECKAQLRKKLTCRPSSLNSKSHRLLTTHVDKKHVKVTRTKTTVTTFDPEIELERRMKEIQKDEKNNRVRGQGVDTERTRAATKESVTTQGSRETQKETFCSSTSVE